MKGISVSSGWATGKVYILGYENYTYNQIDKKSEKSRSADNLKKALYYAAEEYVTLKNGLTSKVSRHELKILDYYIRILQEPEYIKRITDLVLHNNDLPEEAIFRVFSEVTEDLFIDDNHEFSQKDIDIKSLSKQVGSIINSLDSYILPQGNDKFIIVGDNVPFYIFTNMDLNRIAGVVSERGAFSSHCGIYLRSLNIPAVFGVDNILSQIKNGEMITLNGESGEVWLSENPYTPEAKEYVRRRYNQRDCTTKDGKTIRVMGNINSLKEAENLKQFTKIGAGLIRTEFLFMDYTYAPSYYHQIFKYYQIKKACATQNIVFRLFDTASDKKMIFWQRFMVNKNDLIESQIYALLNIFSGTTLNLLIPNVRCKEDVLYIKKIIQKLKEKMDKKRIHYAKKICLGIMVETIECIENLDEIIEFADFAALGTNDLCANFHGINRNDYTLTGSECFDPKFLKMIKEVVSKIKSHHKDIYSCGEMVNSKEGAFVFCGLGLDSLSSSPSIIPQIKRFFSDIDISYAKKELEKLLYSRNSEELLNGLFDIIY